eukprot:m.453921 g.453921  ORF g.453921 m.453921 type:complete len:505 (+) comp21559_c0_seq5:99-1613(+)
MSKYISALCFALLQASSNGFSSSRNIPVGRLATRNSSEIVSSSWSVGAETMDRNFTLYSEWKQYLGLLGVKRARVQAGWARCEPSIGSFSFMWLDEVIYGMHAQGVTPWIQFSYGNPIYGNEAGSSDADSSFPNLATNNTIRNAWIAWVTAVTKRYMNVTSEWEMWNEPDLHSGADGYAVLINITAAAVREVQPDARIILQIAHSSAYAVDVLKQLPRGVVNAVTYHPYFEDPDGCWSSKYVQSLNASIAPFAAQAPRTPTPAAGAMAPPPSGIELLQGESGAPSVTGGYGALSHHDWNETSQAKWALRRMLSDWAHGLRWTSLFSIADMCYGTPEHPDVNHKGLLLVNCTPGPGQKRVIRPKTAYYALQHLTALIDDETVHRKGLTWKDYADVSISIASALNYRVVNMGGRAARGQTSGSLVAVWINTDTPSGNSTYEEATSRTFDLPEHTTFSEPVAVDLLSGVVWPLLGSCRQGGAPCTMPVYDAPVVLVERSQVPLQPRF